MDIRTMRQATQEAVKKRFGGKKYLASRIITRYPQSVEREYVRVVNSYMSLFNKTIAEYIPRISEALRLGMFATDTLGGDSTPTISGIFDEILDDFTTRQGLFGLQRQIEKMATLNRKLTVAEWKRVVKRTLGIDIMEDYYSGVKFLPLFNAWIADNVGLIQTIPQTTLIKMREIINNGYRAGLPNRTLAKMIEEEYETSKAYARFVARDQTAKLNSQITREQQADAGVSEYIWRTVGNTSTFPNSARVRKDHAHLNNTRHK